MRRISVFPLTLGYLSLVAWMKCKKKNSNKGAKQVDLDHMKRFFLAIWILNNKLIKWLDPLWTASRSYQATAASDSSI